MKGNEKSALGRRGLLCLIASGMTIMSCQQESINPPVHLPALSVAPQSFRADSVRVTDDQPPKDVGSGSGTGGMLVTSGGSPADSVRVTDDQPPKDVGSGSGTGGK
ncbi:hypothetical protein [Spirosoma sp.]|uniref:hypothetical protein n=1 Tax=Spirosoma sp. TaxID=1899569 RepID=UPI00262E6A83|nr:hypothetical protein [Spirosoma sp.]MCX6214613.1 hypothetical protein [Spirosoma sp.]